MIEDPSQLLGRLRLGREEYCQRLLTMLILAGPYPRWNSRSQLSEQGTRFLRGVDALSFGEASWEERPLFLDEFDLPKRHEWEAGSAPDYALLWDDRVWVVKLKTEKASNRPAQLPGYFEFADHHYPTRRIDLTYLTPSMPLTPPLMRVRMRFAHVTWEQVVPLVAEVWGNGKERERRVAGMLIAALESIGGNWTTWRADQLAGEHPTAPAAEPADSVAERPGVLEVALALAEATAGDGRQRAASVPRRAWKTCRDSVSPYARRSAPFLPAHPSAALAVGRGHQHRPCPHHNLRRHRLRASALPIPLTDLLTTVLLRQDLSCRSTRCAAITARRVFLSDRQMERQLSGNLLGQRNASGDTVDGPFVELQGLGQTGRTTAVTTPTTGSYPRNRLPAEAMGDRS